MQLHWIDWAILIGTLLFITVYGIIKSRQQIKTAENFLRGGDQVKWWTIGISVMATQASAITFISTPGQAFHDGMGFVQVYLGLPIAMIIICAVFIPRYSSLSVYTAYEFLEQRFDNKTRALTACLFLLQRGLAAGITIYAPSIILSTIFGWDLAVLNMVNGSLVILYTILGGTHVVSATQTQQMAVMIGGMIVAFIFIVYSLPPSVDINRALSIAASGDKMQVINFDFDPKSRYTFWSGITGGLFLALSYFGTDQSQVQRYLSGSNIRQSRLGLLFNGIFKIPMQFFILLCGIMVYVFFQFHKAPAHFNSSLLAKAKATPFASILKQKEDSLSLVFNERLSLLQSPHQGSEHSSAIKSYNAIEKILRDDVKNIIGKAIPKSEKNDKDYVFIHFVLTYLPKGLIGLLLAVIFCASMSSSSSEISALGTCTTIDIYKRNFAPQSSDRHYLNAARWFTLLWGIIAIVFANLSSLFENLIQFVNIIGSIFYGNILGIFLTGFFIKNVKGHAIFIAAIITQIAILVIYFKYKDDLSYLWLNVVGCLLVMGIGLAIKKITDSR